MLQFVSLVVFVLGASVQVTKTQHCHLRELELCWSAVFFAAVEGSPGDEEGLDQRCGSVKESFVCFDEYSESCLTPEKQECLDLVLAEPRHRYALMCTPGTNERAIFLRNGACLQKALGRYEIKPAFETHAAAQQEALLGPVEPRVPGICCGYERLFQDLLVLVERQCRPESLRPAELILRMTTTNYMNIFCRGYQANSTKCDAIPRPTATSSEVHNTQSQLVMFLNSVIDSWGFRLG